MSGSPVPPIPPVPLSPSGLCLGGTAADYSAFQLGFCRRHPTGRASTTKHCIPTTSLRQSTAIIEETSAYAEERFEILDGLTYAKRDIVKDMEPAIEFALGRRIRQPLSSE